MIPLSNPIAALNPFRDSIERARAEYRGAITALPPALRVVAEDHLARRVQRAQGRPMLGEYVPAMVADLLGLQDPIALHAVTVGWQQLVWGILMLDDVIDEPNDSNSTNQLLAANLMIQRGLCQLLATSRNPARLQKTADDAFFRNTTAIITEQSGHRNTVTQYSSSDLASLGDKLAIVDLCIAAIADSLSEWDKSVVIQMAFRKIIAGLQLLDDLTDVDEDLRNGNITYPLTILSGYTQRRLSDMRLNENIFLENVVLSGALSQTLEAAAALIKAGTHLLLTSTPRTRLASIDYFDRLLESITAVSAITDVAQCFLEAEAYRLHDERNAPERQRHLDRLRDSLIVVAQSS